MYIASDLINKGYVLKWDILRTITANLIEDPKAIAAFSVFGFLRCASPTSSCG
jgi:hypothetical protein